MFSDSPELVKSIGAEALPSSWRVVPVDNATSGEIESIGERWRDAPGVYQVVYAKDAVRAVLRISGTVSWSLSLLATVLGFAAWLLLLAGARAAAFSRREELSIMRMVGAGRMMVRLPFVLEGAVAGLAGAIGASVAVSRTSREIESRLSGEGDVAILQSFVITDNKITSVTVLMVLLGILLGASASFWAVGRYVRASEGLPTNMILRTIKRAEMVFKRARVAKEQRVVNEAFADAPLQSAEHVREQQRAHDGRYLEHGEDEAGLSLSRDA
jgi:cell division transport system permease protein